MRVVFRCSARNSLLFVVEPLAVFTVSRCVRVFPSVCVYVHRRVDVFACMHVGLCVCEEVRIFCASSDVPVRCVISSSALSCHCSPTVCVLPVSRLIWLPLRPLCPANLLSLHLSFPPSLFPFFILFFYFSPAFAQCLSLDGVYQDMNYMGVLTFFSQRRDIPGE